MKVLVTGTNRPPEVFAPLVDAGHEVVFGRTPGSRDPHPYTQDELVGLCRDVDGIMSGSLTGRVMEEAPRLRVIVAGAIGYDRVDVRRATELGILVCNSPSPENFSSNAEATIGLMLALCKKLRHNEAILARGDWPTEEDRVSLMWHKTVGIVGLGRIGSGVARRLAAWEVRLLGCGPRTTQEQAQAMGVTLVDLPTLLRESDFVTLHVPLTPETRGLIGEAELRQMKPTAYLLNLSRGVVLDEEALVRAIDEQWIAGAALDVFSREPLPMESPLRRLDPERVILTPHNISRTHAATEAGSRMALDTILKALRGEVPETVVNPQAVPAWQDRIRRVGG